MKVYPTMEGDDTSPFPPPGLTPPRPSTWKEKIIDAAVLCKAVYQIKVKNRDAVLNRPYEQPVGKFEFLPLPNEYQTSLQRLVLVRSSYGHIIVSLRGTKTLRDIVTDFSIRQQPLDCLTEFCGKDGDAEGVMAHRGFWARAKTLPLEPLQQLVDLGFHLVFTGHSMGGAVASLLMLRLLEAQAPESNRRNQLQCFTFGMPMFANPQLAEYLATTYPGHFYHFVSKNDPVPRLMPVINAVSKALNKMDAVADAGFLMDIALGAIQHFTRLPLSVTVRLAASPVPKSVRRRLVAFLTSMVSAVVYNPKPHASSYTSAGHVVMLDMQAGSLEPVKDRELVAQFGTQHLNMLFGQKVDQMEEHMMHTYIAGLFACKEMRSDGALEGLVQKVVSNGSDGMSGGERQQVSDMASLEQSVAEELERVAQEGEDETPLSMGPLAEQLAGEIRSLSRRGSRVDLFGGEDDEALFTGGGENDGLLNLRRLFDEDEDSDGDELVLEQGGEPAALGALMLSSPRQKQLLRLDLPPRSPRRGRGRRLENLENKPIRKYLLKRRWQMLRLLRHVQGIRQLNRLNQLGYMIAVIGMMKASPFM